MRLATLTRPELIFPSIRADSADAVLRALAERLAEQGAISKPDLLYEKLGEREELGSTGIGDGVAIPHCKLKELDEPLLAVGLVPGAGVDFKAVDDKPVHAFFLVISPNDSPAQHLQVLAALSRWLRADHHVAKVRSSSSAEEIYALLESDDE